MTPGNLRAFVQAKLKRISDGTIVENRLRATEEVEQAFFDKREMEYLYSDSHGHVLMDTKTFDQITVPNEIIGDLIKFFKPNTMLTAMLNNGNVVSIEIPKTVELTVTETTPQPKGDGNQPDEGRGSGDGSEDTGAAFYRSRRYGAHQHRRRLIPRQGNQIAFSVWRIADRKTKRYTLPANESLY